MVTPIVVPHGDLAIAMQLVGVDMGVRHIPAILLGMIGCGLMMS